MARKIARREGLTTAGFARTQRLMGVGFWILLVLAAGLVGAVAR